MKYESTTILSLVDEGLKQHQQKVYLATKRDGEWVETGKDEFAKKVRHFALGLYELGVRKGDHVSLHSENSTEWLICDQAILSLGAANVPIYTTQPGDQIKYILENSHSKVHIVSTDELFHDTKSLMKGITNIKAVITIFGSKHKKLKSFESILELGKKKDEKSPDLFERLRSEIKPEDLATLIYTSGTTGDPKGVMLSHNNIASNVLAGIERVPFDEHPPEGQRMLEYLPLSHVFERMITYMYMKMGYPIYYIEDVEEIREDFETVQPIFFATVPRLLEKIQSGVKVKGQGLSGFKKRLYYWALELARNYDPEHPPKGLAALKHAVAEKTVYSKIRALFGDNLIGMVNGGAALSDDIFQFMNAIGLLCVQGYGLTETSPVVSVMDAEHMRIGSSGPALSNVEIKIAANNEILTRGPHVMLGYYENEEKTAEVMTDDGWLKTGDAGKMEDGYLFITDRIKSVFKMSTGKYIAPQTIETKLTNSSFIDQTVVLGYQQKFCSALIVPDFKNVSHKAGAGISAKGINNNVTARGIIQKEVDKINDELAPWERIKKFILLEEPFTIEAGELTPTLKTKRPVINERYKEKINSIYIDRENESTERMAGP